MTDRHPFYESRKFDTLQEMVRQLVVGFHASADQCDYAGNEINQNGNEFWVNFYYSFANETSMTIRCDMEYQGSCVSLKQIRFLG